ncbi:hypothetical protein Leryth_005748 [Lithospermum erythrorhizon]|nr:hypothetical protein Leryth_005748 [Lithospermum erythrorhizon]
MLIPCQEYESDGVDWTKVDFVDNQECLDLFEKKPIGLISLLDEESKFPKATDLTFANKIRQHLDANPCFKGVKDGAFCVVHSAGKVLYNTSGFLEKNRDSLPSDTIQLLSLCSGRLPQAFASKLINQSLKQSVGTKFKGQLFKLMQQLETTKPHFIRCIKPNHQKIPGLYENSIVLEQLRWCGVLEVVRISRSRYPTRLTHQEFTRRFGFLLPDDGACKDPLSTSLSILQKFNILPEMYQVGYTKLYFRAGQIGILQEMRKQLLQGTLGVQKCFRAHRARRYFHELKGGVTTLQSFIRGEIDRRQCKILQKLKEQDARRKLDDQLWAVVQIQSGLRGCLARKHCDRLQNARKLVRDIQMRRRLSEVKDLPSEMLPSLVEELQSQIVMAEATCSQKEKENAALRKQVQQFEARWSEYEAKTKAMEDMWQKQMSSLQIVSLQTNLTAAKKSLGADSSSAQPRSSLCYNGSEDSGSLGSRTPGWSTPMECFNSGGSYLGAGGESSSRVNGLGHLAKEFQERTQTFDDAVQDIVERRQSVSSANPGDELRQLKHQFDSWKKDYKNRLKEAKSSLHKHVNQEGEKVTRKWWGKKTKRLLLHSLH